MCRFMWWSTVSTKMTMILKTTVVLCLAALSIAQPSSYAIWAADSVIARGQGNGLDSSGNALISYEHGEFQWGLRQLFERTGNHAYYAYIQKGVDNVVTDDGTPHGSYVLTDYSLDPLRVGPTFLYLYNTTQEAKYRKAADVFRSQLDSHPRTGQGQFWHKKRYFQQGWLDGIYMGDIFYAQYTAALDPDNTTAWTDITNQFQLMFDNTVQNASSALGLLYHGYDFSHTASWAAPDRGHSPEVWDRALGWYMMALVDILEIIPTSNPGHGTIIQILQTLVPRLRDAADPESGAWWLVMSQAGRERNYFESSGSSMFVYSLLKAVRLGYVTDGDGSIVAAARKAYEYIVDNFVVPKEDGTFDWEGTVIVGSLDQTGSFDYYVSQKIDVNDLKGVAAFLLASLEIEML